MSRYTHNLVVVGAGSAGLVTSYLAATLKARVALIEKGAMGGDCLNTGCVPSKALLRSAKFIHDASRARELGFRKATVEFDFAEVMERVRSKIRAIEPHDSVERYTKLGVDCLQGAAKLISPNEVEVGGKVLRSRAIVVATGAGPRIPAIPGLDSVRYLTSESVWELKSLPKRLLVLGGGAIGCELAQAFARFGSEVTIVEQGPRLLSKEDEAVSSFIEARFAREGIRVLTSRAAQRFETGRVVCSDGTEVAFDEVLVALGREARVKGFGLEELGVKLAPSGTIAVDESLSTSVPGIYACGDVAGPYQFTHYSAHQAYVACINALFGRIKKIRLDDRVMPWATFTDPEIARVGLNEQEARAKGVSCELTRYSIEGLDRAITEEEAQGFVSVLTQPGTDRVIGVTSVGAHASETIVEFVAAMKHGFGLKKILGTIHIYPTLAEANKSVAGEWRKRNAPKWVYRLLEKYHAFQR